MTNKYHVYPNVMRTNQKRIFGLVGPTTSINTIIAVITTKNANCIIYLFFYI